MRLTGTRTASRPSGPASLSWWPMTATGFPTTWPRRSPRSRQRSRQGTSLHSVHSWQPRRGVMVAWQSSSTWAIRSRTCLKQCWARVSDRRGRIAGDRAPNADSSRQLWASALRCVKDAVQLSRRIHPSRANLNIDDAVGVCRPHRMDTANQNGEVQC